MSVYSPGRMCVETFGNNGAAQQRQGRSPVTNLGADTLLAGLLNGTHMNIKSGWFTRHPSPLLVYLTVHDLEVRTQEFQKATALPIS